MEFTIAVLCCKFCVRSRIRTSAQESEERKKIEFIVEKLSGGNFEEVNKQNYKGYLDLFSRKAKFKFTDIRINNKYRISEGDFNFYRKRVNDLSVVEGLNFSGKPLSTPIIHINHEIAIVHYAISIHVKIKKEPAMNAVQTVNAILEKESGKWKITNYNVILSIDEIFKDDCVTDILATNANEKQFLTKTRIPGGNVFLFENDDFTFTTTADGNFIYTMDYKYLWDKNEQIILLDTYNEEVKKLGAAESRKEAIVQILNHHIYENSCINLKGRMVRN